MSAKKTKPLSDLTNAAYNLIPTSTLRKLVNNPNLSASVLGPKRRTVPFSRSETSVGSTSVSSSTVARNPNDSTVIKGDNRNKTAEQTKRTQKAEKSNKENESSDAVAAKKRDDKGKAIVEAPSSVKRKQRETYDKLILGPPKVDAISKQKLASADVAIQRASSSKKPAKTKLDYALISSCPAIARTKSKKSRKEAEPAAEMKSRTEPRPKRGEKNFANFRYGLPRDSIEQQKAYFDDIDAFELVVEEVSKDEVDKSFSKSQK